MEAFPWPSRYIDGSAKTINAASHHGIMQANERRAPARHPRISATRQQTDRQAKPNQNGSKRTQNLALAPSGWRKYPYVRPVCGTRRVKACLCQNQIVRITTTAARNGRNDFTSWSKTRLSPIANPSRTTHQATKTKGSASVPYCSPIIIVPGVARTTTIRGAIVARATAALPVRAFVGEMSIGV